MRFARRDNVIVRRRLLQHEPRRFHVITRVAQSRRASKLPSVKRSCKPNLMRAAPSVILRVTKFSPRRGDS
jgi:hypothetical protein